MYTCNGDGQSLPRILIKLELALLSWHLSELWWKVFTLLTSSVSV